MSGGQKQRVMIALTLAARPDYLIADEPTTALDVTIQAQILDLLRDLQREQGMGMLLITHDLAVVSGMAHRVALMYAGQIVEVASTREFFAQPRHPYAQALLRALPDATRRAEALEAIGGTVPALTQAFQGCRFAPRCAQVMPQCERHPPPLVEQGGRLVRCVLYADGPRAPALQTPEEAPPTAQAHAARASRAATLLDVRNLSVRFPIRTGVLRRVHAHFEAVRQVSFQVGTGRTLALVGESGCGKTTTGKAIVQLLRRQAVIEGQALFGGLDLFTLQGDALQAARRDIQIVFQDPFASLDPRMRVFEILEEGLIALHPSMTAADRRSRVEHMTDRVGLRRDALDRYPHEFSGGQRQRIAIARALAVQPKLIVCDEPTSALDVSVQAQILNLLRELQADLGVSYLFITHNIGVVEYIADEVAVMRAGAIVESGSTERVLGAPQAAYTRSLLASVPRVAVD
jgi:peptide/nickel transport system ATP-binding protein